MVRSERFSERMCRSNERARGERGGLSMTPQEIKPVIRCSSGTQLHEPAPDVKMTSISACEGLVVGLPGLEPGTSSLSGMRSNRLSYRPVALGNVAQGVGDHVRIVRLWPRNSAITVLARRTVTS